MRFARFLVENERLLVVAASTMIMSLSHTALRPVLPVFAKVPLGYANIALSPIPVVNTCVLLSQVRDLLASNQLSALEDGFARTGTK